MSQTDHSDWGDFCQWWHNQIVSVNSYGGEHKKRRAQIAPLVEAGYAVCCAVCCLEPDRRILPGQLWDLGHAGAGRWAGPEHRRCNRSAGAREGNAARRRRPKVV